MQGAIVDVNLVAEFDLGLCIDVRKIAIEKFSERVVIADLKLTDSAGQTFGELSSLEYPSGVYTLPSNRGLDDFLNPRIEIRNDFVTDDEVDFKQWCGGSHLRLALQNQALFFFEVVFFAAFFVAFLVAFFRTALFPAVFLVSGSVVSPRFLTRSSGAKSSTASSARTLS